MGKKKGNKKGDDWEEPVAAGSDSKTGGDDFISFNAEGEEQGEQEEEVSDLMSQIMSASKKGGAGAGGKKGKKQKKLEELEEMYSAGDKDETAPPPEDEDDSKQKGGKKGKKGKKKDDYWDNYDPNNPESQAEPEPEKPTGKKGQQQKQQQEPVVEQDDAEENEDGPKGKNAKKKGKKPAAAAAAKPAATPAAEPSKPAEPEPAKPAGKDDPKKKKSPGAAIKAMLQKQREEEERIRKLQEEEERKFQEEQERLEALEREKEEAKKRKKEKEKAKKEQLKKEGKLLSKTEKERLQRAEQVRAMLLQQSGIKIGGVIEKQQQQQQQSETTGESSETQAQVQEKKKKPIYTKKKKNVNQKNDQKQEEKKEENQVEESKAGPAVDSWEDIDLDTIVVPGQKQPVAEPKKEEVVEESEESEEESEEEEEEDQVEAVSTTLAKTTITATKGAERVRKLSERSDKSDKNDEDDDSEDDDDSDDGSEDDDSDDDDEDSRKHKRAAAEAAEEKKRLARERRLQRHQEALASRSKDNLRSPICCILGHVDTGKTKILDKIRQTDVQGSEAGGITQQIGATYFPNDVLVQKTSILGLGDKLDIKVPGLLIIDTPGHESFTNLRSRGSSLCNIAILVIDMMHYLEPQTIESINLLKQRRTPFIVALNKVDRIYGWKPNPDSGIQQSLAKQSESAQREFEDRLEKTKLALAEQGFNSEVYYKNKDMKSYVSIVPTSAVTGEGIPDMIMLLIQLTQRHLTEQLMYLSELEATVLEVKVTEGQGTTLDVVLSNGYLREGDKICVCGLHGPIITHIRALLTPQPLRELRVKSQYVHHKEVKASIGVKIAAPGLEKAIAGSRLMVIGPDDDEDDIKEEVMSDLAGLFKSIDKSGKGVSVQASTLGSLEALLEFLKVSKIPVFSINIGPVHRKDVIRSSIMLDRHKEYAVMLCFDVKVEREAEEVANELGIKIFKAEIIYHLFDQFTAYMNDIQEQKKKDMAPKAVFPCILRILPAFIFNTRNPILVGVNVAEGTLRIGTPICIPSKGKIYIGNITGIENNHKSVEVAKKGQDVAIKIELPNYETPKMLGRHFFVTDDLVSQISRESIDILKEAFRDEMTKEDWQLVIRLKKVMGIP